MTTRHLLLGFLGLTLPMAACSRAGLNAIVPAPGAGGSGVGGSGVGGSGAGGSGVGGSGVGGSGVGGSGVGGSGVGGSGVGGSGAGGSGAGGTGIDAGTGGTTAAACPTPILATGDTDQSVQVGSTTRTYFLHIPPKYTGTKPVPLILDFHAQNSTGALEAQSSTYQEKTDPEGVVMAFPNGKGTSTGWNIGPCCVSTYPDDLAFARTLVQQISTIACIDKKRVYAVGLATGGGMAYYLACNAADMFAAVAPSAFDLIEETVDDCKPSRPITVISFRGSADFLVPYGGGYSTVVSGMPITFLGAKITFAKWAAIDQCVGNPTTDTNNCSAYSNCQGGAEVILCTKPGIMAAGDASIAWPILKRHSLP